MVERRQCICGANLPIVQDLDRGLQRWPNHNIGDLPTWLETKQCGQSGRLVRRRKPKSKAPLSAVALRAIAKAKRR